MDGLASLDADEFVPEFSAVSIEVLRDDERAEGSVDVELSFFIFHGYRIVEGCDLVKDFLAFLPFKSRHDLATESHFAFGFRFSRIVCTDIADVIAASTDDVVTFASASDAADSVFVVLEFVRFHSYKVTRDGKKARDFFTINETFFVDVFSNRRLNFWL